MSSQTLDPNSDRTGSGDFTITGSASTITQALSDNSDTTFVKRTSGTLTKAFVLNMGTYTLGANEAIQSVAINVRMLRPASAKLYVRQGVVIDAAAGIIRYGAADQYSGTASLSTASGAARITSPTGATWDQTTLNNLVVKVTDYASASAAITSVYELEAVVNTNSRPSASITGPSGSITDSSRPAVSWNYSDSDGDPQSVYEVKVFTAAQYAATGFSPDTTSGEWESGLVTSTDPGVTVPVDLETGTTYYAYVRVGHPLGTGEFLSNWSSSSFTMSYAAQPQPDLDVAYSTTNNVVYITATGRTNYLSDEDAVFTSSVGTWTAVQGCNLTRTTAQYLIGVASLQVEATSAATMKARTGLYPVATDGQSVSGIASFRADAVGRQSRVSLYWYNSSASLISITDGSLITSNFTSWTTASVAAVPPAGAASAALGIEIQSPASGEDHFVDKVALHPGPTPTWSPGGLYSTQTIIVERSTDNGVTWEGISEQDANTPNQVAQSDDYTALRGQTNVYRARVSGITSSQEVLSSAWSDDAAAFAVNDGKWWLKAIGQPDYNIGDARVIGPLQDTITQSVGVFRPLGRSTPVVVSGEIYGSDGEYSILLIGDAEWEAAQQLLFGFTGDVCVQAPFGTQKIVRITSRSVEEEGTAALPRRTVSVGYVEVS